MKTGRTKVIDFANYDFESCDVPEDCYGDYPHVNFYKKYFTPVLRKELKKIAKNIGVDVDIHPGYFESWARFGRDGEYAEVIIGDVRYCPDWFSHVLYRTCEPCGSSWDSGSNQYCSFSNLQERLDEMFNKVY